MNKTQIFRDEQKINASLAAPRADAAKIQKLLDLIGETTTPEGEPATKSGMDLVKDLATRFDPAGYLQKIMVNRQSEDLLNQAIQAVKIDHSGKTQNLNLFSINEAGKVEHITEVKEIEENTYFIENEAQEEYIEKAQTLVLAWNDLESFLQDHKLPGIESNRTMKSLTDRFLFSFRDAAKNYQTIEANLRAVNDLK